MEQIQDDMSLFDKYHSQLNKDYMLNMIYNTIFDIYRFDLKSNGNFKDKYEDIFKNVFEKNNYETIEEINKHLLNDCIQFYKNELLIDENNETTIDQLNNETTIDQLNNETTIDQLNNVNNSLEKTYTSFYVSSTKRSNVNSSRYNYQVKVTQPIHCINKIILPIEKNYIFNIPIIHLEIKELNYTILLQQEKIIKHNHKQWCIYLPIEDKKIHTNMIPEKITIDIRDVNQTKYIPHDIPNINMLELFKNRIYFTCSVLKINDFNKNDFIKIINYGNLNHKISKIIKEPLLITMIKNNVIGCEIEYNENDLTYNDIDMKIINTSNQNMVFFN